MRGEKGRRIFRWKNEEGVPAFAKAMEDVPAKHAKRGEIFTADDTDGKGGDEEEPAKGGIGEWARGVIRHRNQHCPRSRNPAQLRSAR